ncbi:MAG TPA: hypothetical protein VG916_05820, partial [Gemmatimonadaceae bacterium]|nr:hypothetical protein [Gemmatimonadaceae bacterium]
STGSHSKVLLYLHQARNDSRSSVGDRAIIETISPGPVKVVFATEALKSRVIQQPQNPFRCVFVVDVDVGTVNGRPTLYTVTALHDVFEHPDAA